MQIKLFFWRHSGATFLYNSLFVRQESFPLAYKQTSHSELVEITSLFIVMHLSMLCRRGGGGVRQGMGWAFDWFCSPRRRDIWIFLHPTWEYLTADSDEKDWDGTYVSHFHVSRMRRTVWKDYEIMEANENNRKLSGFHCFVFKFRLF